MLKKFSFYFLLLCVALKSAAALANVKTGLSNILQIKEQNSREKQFISYVRNYFQSAPVRDINSSKAAIIDFLKRNNFESKDALIYFTESVCEDRLSHVSDSKTEMIAAIRAATKSKDDYLTCSFLNFLAYKQTEEGNVIGAVSSYRLAKKAAIKMGDTNMQMIIDINISDVYYKNNFYSQSLFYLDQALAIVAQYWPDDQRIRNKIYYNKSENFFRMNKADSLLVYNENLNRSKANTYKLYTYRKRTDYYLYLLYHDYKNAINLIHEVQKDEGYKFDDEDLQNLSDAFYKNSQPDSAKAIINQLLSKQSEANHPEVKYHLYDVLGKIAEQNGDYKSASANFKLSLQQSEDNMNRLTQVDNISSLIKVDEIEGYYSQKNESYRRERTWLIFAVVLALLVVLIIAMFYRTIKQKRHYEKLLFAAKKEELSFLNSHEVRKHLTNIMGIVDVIRHSDNNEKEYLLAEKHLLHSAEELDKSIKNISEKLDA